MWIGKGKLRYSMETCHALLDHNAFVNILGFGVQKHESRQVDISRFVFSAFVFSVGNFRRQLLTPCN